MRAAVRTFAMVSIAGLISAIAGGVIGGAGQYWLWGLTIVLDVVAASVGASSDNWNLHPKHFAERHGLFVIIALGETLIVAASAVAEESMEGPLLLVSMLAVGITSAFWWIYFFRTKEHMEHAMASKTGKQQSEMGRDAYSLLHFPMICGLIIYAFAIEEAMMHPTDELTFEGKLALALGILLFIGGLVLSYWRATGKILYVRFIGICLIAGACLFIVGIGAVWTMGIALAGLIALSLVEEKLDWKKVSHA
jgi:low temperature requirement protein LtrA